MKTFLTRSFYLIIGLLVVLSLQGKVAADPAPTPPQADSIATLEPVQGLIQYQTAAAAAADPASWQTAFEPVFVGEGDRIRTDRAGQAYLTFFEGAETEIGPSTLVIVSTLDLGPSGEFNVSLDVLVGSALSSVEVALDPEDRFEIHTPSATAVVRGTRWWTIVAPNGQSTFSSERGLVEIIPNPLTPPATGERAFYLTNFVDLTEGSTLRTDLSGLVEEELIEFQPPEPPAAAPLAGADCGDGVCAAGEASTCSVDCFAEIEVPNCGNGTCDADEDLILCAADCGPSAGSDCGNGTCDRLESNITCPADCQIGQYFSPLDPNLCGNAICETTESALTCPTDCRPTEPPAPEIDAEEETTAPVQTQPQAAACGASGNNINIRSGPGTTYLPVGSIKPGETLPVTGQSWDGRWLLVSYYGQGGWVARRVVTLTGTCGGLVVFDTAPVPGSGTSGDSTTATGSWGGCGSCTTCGYPTSECVSSPDGTCIWDPTACRPQPVTGSPVPLLTVPQATYTCTSTTIFQVTATYTPPQGSFATVSSWSYIDNFLAIVTSSWLSGSYQVTYEIYCAGTSGSDTVTFEVTDTDGNSASTSIQVIIS